VLPDGYIPVSGAAMMLVCAPNFRDLGGCRVADGRVVRYGRIFRSEAILSPCTADIAALASHGIGVVFDLRSASEAASCPNDFLRSQGAEILNFNVGADVRAKGTFWDMLAEDASPLAVEALLQKLYRAIPKAVTPALRALFERLDSESPPILLHCTAGKDRTGVVSAMLLQALGASREVVIGDYLETKNRLTEKWIAEGTRTMNEVAGRPVHPETLDMLIGVRRDFLEQSFSWMERKFGDADSFLRAEAGLTDDRRARIRDRLLEAA
jgi:protein-tyrosine phosphatase